MKWYRSLGETERLAWLDMVQIIGKKPSHVLSQHVAYMVFRLALLLLPAHREALQSLHEMKMPLGYVRDLERFILSDPYGRYREHIDHHMKVPVPSYASLYNQLFS